VIATWSAFAATRRRLTGVARGGALDIARHSLLRGLSWAAAGATRKESKARKAQKDRSMAGLVVTDELLTCNQAPVMTLISEVRHAHRRLFFLLGGGSAS
jgi:hypothetical protein